MKAKIVTLTTILILLLFTSTLRAQTPTLEWIKHMLGEDNNHSEGISVTTDANGNVYTTGRFYDTTDFDPGTGTANLTSAGQADIFIQKLDTNGDLLWAKRMGSTGYDKGMSITTDTDGNVYSIGRFAGTVDFDPGEATAMLTSAGKSDIYIQKLDADGNFIWARQMGGPKNDEGNSIATDADGNVYATGIFMETADFDSGAGTANLTAVGKDDIFVLKLDTDGNFLWAKQMGGIDNDAGNSIAVDSNRNVYTTGFFADTVDFDPGNQNNIFTSAGRRDIFIQKLDTNGNLLWVNQMGSTGYDEAESITIDAFNDIYTTGSFYGTVDFDPGAGTTNLTSAGQSDIFVQKLDTNGNLLWAKQMGGTGYNQGRSITTDTKGNVYTTGFFTDTADFDPGAETANLTSPKNYDMFIQKLDRNGNFLWVQQNGGMGDCWVNSINLDGNGSIHTTGAFYGIIDFDPGSGTTNLDGGRASDIFIQKLNQPSLSVLENSLADKFVVHPNPTKGKFSIEFKTFQKSVDVRLFSITGQLLMKKPFQNTKNLQLDIDQPHGIYLLEIKDGQGNKTVIKVIKQ